MTRDVAVVILNYNGHDYLFKFLPTVIQFSGDAQIWVADNASTDASRELLKMMPQVRLIQMEKNLGYAGGYNEALKHIDASYYILLNSDVEVTEGWISPLYTFMEANMKVAAVQPKILDYKDQTRFEYAGACGGYLDALGYPYCRGRLFDAIEQDQGQYDSEVAVAWATGACMMVRSSVFHAMKGFDADFFAHMEEIDLCWRMRSQGHLIYAVPSAIVYHVGGGTLHKISPRKTYLNFRNGQFMLFKNLPYLTLLWVYPIRMVLDLLAALLYWRQSGPKHFAAVLQASGHALLKAPRYLAEKQRSKPRQHAAGAFSVVWDYFVSRRRKFRDL